MCRQGQHGRAAGSNPISPESLCLPPLLFLSLISPATASSTPSSHAKAELIAAKDSIEPGQDSWLGLRFELEKGWHIYWINPGDSGEPPRVQWHLPPGFRAGAIRWPAPQRIQDHSLVDYGYQGETLLLVPIHVPGHVAVGDIPKFDATVKWLVCRETCIPERADLTLSLRVQRKEARQKSQWQELFRTTIAHLPQPLPHHWRIAAVSEKDHFIVSIETGSPQPRASFFPLEPNQIENAAPQEASPLPHGVRLKLRKSDQLLKPLSHLKGVVQLGSRQTFVVDARVTASNSNGS